MRGQVADFHVDHVVPQNSGGKTEPQNLALSCPFCNNRKWTHTTAVDPETGETVAIFNPRDQIWEDHFHWSDEDPTHLEGKTPSGRATIELLRLNHHKQVAARQFLLELGLFPEPQADR